MRALTHEGAASRLTRYYSIDSNYAGSLFLGIEPRDPHRITAGDLFAVTMLNVDIPARAARRLLSDPECTAQVSEALVALPAIPLEQADGTTFDAMERLYGLVKRSLLRHGARDSNAWVTASKIVARKRPDLFPVRDRKVTALLGLREHADVRVDWQAYAYLMNQSDVRSVLISLSKHLEARSTAELSADSELLRILDVALWMHTLDVA